MRAHTLLSEDQRVPTVSEDQHMPTVYEDQRMPTVYEDQPLPTLSLIYLGCTLSMCLL